MILGVKKRAKSENVCEIIYIAWPVLQLLNRIFYFYIKRRGSSCFLLHTLLCFSNPVEYMGVLQEMNSLWLKRL